MIAEDETVQIFVLQRLSVFDILCHERQVEAMERLVYQI
jgi:hypothetical protein